MGLAPDVKVVVKHTFLEVVDEVSSGSPNAQRPRAVTDPAMFASINDWSQQLRPQDPLNSHVELAGSSASSSSQAPAMAGGRLPPLREEPPEGITPYVAFGGAPDGVQAGRVTGAVNASAPGIAPMGFCLVPLHHTAFAQPTAGHLRLPQSAESRDRLVDGRTTLMLRNLPNEYSRSTLLLLIDSLGFAGRYNFVYVPVDFGKGSSLGYAFVNLCEPTDAECFMAAFQGFSRWSVPSEQTCEVVWSDPNQGWAALVERYKNSPVMHQSVPDEWKPAVFTSGLRNAFPPPTKPLKAPKPPRVRSKAA